MPSHRAPTHAAWGRRQETRVSLVLWHLCVGHLPIEEARALINGIAAEEWVGTHDVADAVL